MAARTKSKPIISTEAKNIIFALAIIIIFLSSPLFMGYLANGSELGVYFLETNGIRGPFLYVPLLLHRMGFGVGASLKIFIMLMNISAALSSWWCFSRISGNIYSGLAGTVSYMFSLYSIHIRYSGGSLGEITVMVFLPIITYGFYCTVTGSNSGITKATAANTRSKTNQWLAPLILFVGLSGAALSHIPQFFIILIISLILCILSWRHIRNRRTLISLLLSYGGSLILSFPLLLPYLRAMLAGKVYIEPLTEGSFAQRGLELPQLLMSFFGNTGSIPGHQMQLQFMGLGLPLLAVLAAFLFLFGLKEIDKLTFHPADTAGKGKNLTGLLAAAAVICGGLSLRLFPWDVLQGLHWLPRVIIEHIGYPWRFLLPAVLLLSLLTSLLGKAVLSWHRHGFWLFFLAVVALNLLSGFYYMNDIVMTTEMNHSLEPAQQWLESEFIFYISK